MNSPNPSPHDQPWNLPERDLPADARGVLHTLRMGGANSVELIAEANGLSENGALSWLLWLCDRDYVCKDEMFGQWRATTVTERRRWLRQRLGERGAA